MKKFLFNEMAIVFLAYFIFFLLLVTKAHNEELKALCWTKADGRGTPCVLKEDDTVCFLNRGCTDKFYVAMTNEDTDGNLLVYLIEKEQ